MGRGQRLVLGTTIAIATAVLGLVGLRVWASSAPTPPTLGVAPDGGLAPCPPTPNCISSTAVGPAATAPLPLPAGGIDAVARVIEALPRTDIVTREGPYLHAESRTAIVGYVDDLEVIVDVESGVVHVRSASRLGTSDLGVNADRVEQLRALLAAS